MSNTATLKFAHDIIDNQGPLNPHVKVMGDITGNGLADAVVASSEGGPLLWYEAPGWTPHQIAPTGRWSCDAKLVDMDGDGDLDLLIPEWYTHNRLEWFENPLPNGDPRTTPWKHHIVGEPRAHNVETGDLDGDGQLEIVTRTQGDDGDHIVVRKHTGDTWRQVTIPCPVGEGLALGDMTGNGKPNIVIGGHWFDTPSDLLGGKWEVHTFAEWPADANVQLADMNGDGRLDIILARSEGPHRLSWFEAPEDRSNGTIWTEHIVEPSIDFVHSLRVCDLNNDGAPDIVAAEMHQSERKRVMVFVNGGGSRSWHAQTLSNSGSHAVAVGDTSGNGLPDIVGANWSGDYQPVELWRNGG